MGMVRGPFRVKKNTFPLRAVHALGCHDDYLARPKLEPAGARPRVSGRSSLHAVDHRPGHARGRGRLEQSRAVFWLRLHRSHVWLVSLTVQQDRLSFPSFLFNFSESSSSILRTSHSWLYIPFDAI